MLRKKYRKAIFRGIIVLLFSFCQISCSRDETQQIALESVGMEQSEEKNEENGDLDETHTETIFVYVCGAVVQEGVYELTAGSRVYEAIQKAGGLREDAAESAVNQAEILKDEAQIYIPTEEEALQEQEKEQSEKDGKVNINTATKEELMTLPGVGESKANSIITYRETNGGFQTIEEIMQISGIKEGLFAKIKDYITI